MKKKRKEKESKIPCLVRVYVRLTIAVRIMRLYSVPPPKDEHFPRLKRWRYIEADTLPF